MIQRSSAQRLSLLMGLWGLAGSAMAFDSYVINVPTNVMKGDPDVFFTVTPYTGAAPDLTPHNVYIDLPTGVAESPLANPPGGLDWSSVVSWGLFANNAVSPGNTPLTVTEAFAASPVTSTKYFNLQNVVRSFEIVPPSGFSGTAGVPFSITVRAKDGLGGGGALVTGFNDNLIVTASTGDVVVNAGGNIISGGDFVNGEATVSVMLRGTDPVSRTNRITVTATINYFGLGLASGYTDVNMNPGDYHHVVLLFPGEALRPGLILSPLGKTGTATSATANISVPGVTAYLVDQFNNPIITPASSVTLAFESLTYPGFPRPPNDSVPGLKIINVGNNVSVGGEFIFYRSGEVHQVRAYDFDDPAKNSVTSILVNSGAPNLIAVSAVSSPQYPGRSFLANARVVDGTPAANTVTSYPNTNPVTVSLTNCAGSSFPLGTIDTNPSAAGIQTTVFFTNGVFTGPLVVFPKVATACLKFDDGLGNFGESGSFTILNGDELRLMVVMPDQVFTPGQSPGASPAGSATRLAGTLVNVQVYVVDQGWNVVDNVTGGWSPGPVTISLESVSAVAGYVDLVGGTPAMPASGAFATVTNVRLRTAYPAGNGRLVARMSGLEGTSVPLTINPEAYNQLVFVVPGETLASGIQSTVEPDGKLGLPNSQVVNVNFPVSVYLTDVYFNSIVNAPLAGGLWPTLTFSTAAPVGAVATFPFSNPFSMTDSSFDNLVGLGTLGANVLHVVDNSPTPKTINQTIDVTPGEVTRFLVTPNSASSTADAIDTQSAGVPFNLTFKAFDAAGNRATNFSGTVQLELWEGSAPVPYAGTISPSSITFVAHPVTGGQVVDQPITITYAGPSLGLGADGLKVRAFVTSPTMREGFSASFNVKEDPVWRDIVLTRAGESRRPGLGAPFKTGTPTPVLAGNSFPVTVTAVDVYGNRVDQSGIADLSVLTAGVFANLGSPAQVTFSNGLGSGTVQIYTAGSSILLATVTANGFNDRSTGTITVGSYSASTGKVVLLAPGEVLLPGSPSAPGKNSAAISSVEANTAMSYSLYACDRYYNRDTTYSGNTFSLSSDDGAIDLTSIAVNSGSTTVSSVFLKGHLPNPSTVRVTATDESDVSKTSYSDVPVTPGATYVVTVPTSTTVGVNFSVTVDLIDPDTGLPMVGANNAIAFEALTSSGATSTVPIGVAGATLTNGTVTIDQNYSYVETIKIRVTDSFNRVAESGNIVIVPNGLKYKVTLPVASKSVDDLFSVTVGLYDTIQDLLPIRSSSYQHSFNVSVEAGGLPAVGSAPLTTATLTEGEATFNFSYTKAEHIVVRASGTLVGYPAITGFDDMDITPGAYVKVQVLAPGEVAIPGVPSLTGKDSSGILSQAAREDFSLTVNAVDRYWNVVTSLNTPLAPTVRLTASDGSLSLSLQGYSNGQSLFSGVTLNSPPSVTVTADDTSSAALFPQSVVIPLTGRAYVASVTPNFPPNYYSGPPRDFDVDLTLYRFSGGSTGAIVSGFSGNVFIEPLTPSLEALPVGNVVIVSPPIPDLSQPNMIHMDPSGVLNLTLAYRVAEDVVLKFTDEDGWQGFSETIHFIPRDVDYAVTTPVESRVGPPDTFSMTITPRDADTGTTAKNWSRTVSVAAGSPAAVPITGTLQVTSLLLDGGASTFQQAFSQAGVFYFTVSDGVKSSTSAAMNFLPGPLASLTTDIPATIEAGSTQTVHVTLLDAFDNPIPNLTLAFALSDASFGTLSTLTGVSNVLGQSATVFATNGQKSGLGSFTGTSGSVSVSQAFRLLGPPSTSLRVDGLGVEEGKGYALKPRDPIFMDIAVESGTVLVSVSYSVNGGLLQTSAGPFDLLPSGLYTFELPIGTLTGGEYVKDVGRYTVEYFGTTVSGLTHSETVKTSKTFFVSAETTAEEGLVNYPNPFRAGQDLCYLEYVLTPEAGVRLTIYDMMGQRVYERSYSQGEAGGSAGLNRISWDGKNDDGEVVGNGGYVAVLEVSGGPKLKRKIAVKK